MRIQVSLSLWPFQALSEAEWQTLRRSVRAEGALLDDESFLSDWFDVDVPSEAAELDRCGVDP
jgi:hypothetical protein